MTPRELQSENPDCGKILQDKEHSFALTNQFKEKGAGGSHRLTGLTHIKQFTVWILLGSQFKHINCNKKHS